MVLSIAPTVKMSTQRDKDKGIVLAPLLSFLRVVCISYLSLTYPSSPNNYSLHVL